MTNQKIYDEIKSEICSTHKWTDAQFKAKYEAHKKALEAQIQMSMDNLEDSVVMGLAKSLGIDVLRGAFNAKTGDRVPIDQLELPDKDRFLKERIVGYVAGVQTRTYNNKDGEKGNWKIINIRDDTQMISVAVFDSSANAYEQWDDIVDGDFVELSGGFLKREKRKDESGELGETGNCAIGFVGENAMVLKSDPKRYEGFPSFEKLFRPKSLELLEQESGRYVLNLVLIDAEPKIVYKKDNDDVYSVKSLAVITIGAEKLQTLASIRDVKAKKYPDKGEYWRYWKGTVFGFYNHEGNTLSVDRIISTQKKVEASMLKITSASKKTIAPAPKKRVEPKLPTCFGTQNDECDKDECEIYGDCILETADRAKKPAEKLIEPPPAKAENKLSIEPSSADVQKKCFGQKDDDLDDCKTCDYGAACDITTKDKIKPQTESKEPITNTEIMDKAIQMLREHGGKADLTGLKSFLGMALYEEADIESALTTSQKDGIIAIEGNKVILKQSTEEKIEDMSVTRDNIEKVLKWLMENDKKGGFGTDELTKVFLVNPSKVLEKLKKDDKITRPKEGQWRRKLQK